jgi:hypothetical protein
MADITMCTGEGCPIKLDCYRHIAFPNQYWQSYFSETPGKYVEEGQEIWECNYYIPSQKKGVKDE